MFGGAFLDGDSQQPTRYGTPHQELDRQAVSLWGNGP
jgi:hypothetical protein